MFMEFKDRLKKELKKKGFTNREFAKLIDVHYMTVQHWLWGISEPTYKNIKKIKKYININ